MELLKLVKVEANGEKTFYKVNADIDKNKNEITLIIEKGIIGQRKVSKHSHTIKSSDIKLSSKKGINTIEKFAKEMGNKIYTKKKKEGFEYYVDDKKEEDSNNVNENKNTLNENEQINANNNISIDNDINNNMTQIPKINGNTFNAQDTIINLDNMNDIEAFALAHEIVYKSPNKMIQPKVPVEHRFFEPMLAHPYHKRKRDIIFPCYVQPKLDGVRCVVVDSELYSRYGNKFPTLSHIKEELIKNSEKLLLDGELYTDDIKFEKIVGLVKKGKKTEEEEKKSLKIYLNVFDYVEPGLTFDERISNLNYFFKQHNFQHIRLVKTERCFSEKEIQYYLDKYTKEGYEGVMMRNIEGKYQPKIRSIHLQKLKKSCDEEFEIIGFSAPDSGAEHGCVIWTCRAKNGRSFNVKPLGNLDDRRFQFLNGKSYIGKKLTVKYQELTNYGIPRFPIGLGIRDYE